MGRYNHYCCARGAHLVRDCLYIAQHEEQEWVPEMADLMLRIVKAADRWRKRGVQAVPAFPIA